jgi:CHASE3 domain sensor protein
VCGPEVEVRGGLLHRTTIASGLLAVIVAATFALLLSMIAQLREAGARAQHSDEVLVVANRLERLLGDLETGERGFLITGEEDLLQPWQAARADFPEQATMLERMVADNPAQQDRAQGIAQAGTSYIQDYSVPLVGAE